MISQQTIDAVKQVTTLELAERMGDQPKRVGASFQVYCPNPAHHEKTPDTYIMANQTGWKCFGGGGCGAQGNDALKYYAWKMWGSWDPKQHFVDAVVGVANLMGIAVIEESHSSHRRSEVFVNPSSSFSRKQREEIKARSAEDCDRIYRKFLELCPVYREHAAEWLGPKRQYTADQVRVLGLKSVPVTHQEIFTIIQALHQQGESLERIPGFTQRLRKGGNPANERDWYWTFSVSSGYFIPVRDDLGRIVRMRVKTDGNSKMRYIWFSSTPNIDMETDPVKMRRGGAPSGAPLNVVVPFDQLRIWEPGNEITDFFRMDTVICTEGEHKSAIAANRLKKPVIGVPGVGNFSEVIPTVKRWETKKLVIAYDSDSLYKEEEINGRNEQVFQQLVLFAKQLLDLDIEVVIWTWNSKDGKGLDDLLMSGKLPIEINLKTKQRYPVVLTA